MSTIKNIVKVDDNNIAVVRETEAIQKKELEPVIYNYNFLLKQKADIQEQWDKQLEEINVARQAEMDEVDALILEADKLDVVAEEVKP